MDSLCLYQLEAFYISCKMLFVLLILLHHTLALSGFRGIAQETVNTDLGYHKHTMGLTQKSDVIGKNNKRQR